MLKILDLFVFIIGTLLSIKSIKHILKGEYSILHVCVIVFYIMQIFQLFIAPFGELDKIEYYYKFIYEAMIDAKTAVIYDVFSLFTICILYNFANKYSKYSINRSISFINNKSRNKKFLLIILGCGTILPLIFAVLLSPNPSIYFKFLYFYTNSYSVLSDIYLYHISTLKLLSYISFFSIVASYYLSSSKNKILFVVPIFLLTWINMKRTLLFFILIAIIIIDFLKWNKSDKKKLKKIIKKTIVFLIFGGIYYLLYNRITQKASFADGYLLYTIYFSRLCNVKMAIYDLLYTHSMIDYPFQTIIYDLLFFIPRAIWVNKPYGYYLYFTSYIFYGVGNIFTTNYGFQVNIWSEFITNGGLIGYLCSLFLIILIAKKCEKSNNLIYIIGSSFIILYMTYGFEHIVQIVYLLFVFLVIVNFLLKKIRR